MSLGFSPLLLKHLLGHPLLLFCHLIVNGIGIITACLWCSVAGVLKRLHMAINRLKKYMPPLMYLRFLKSRPHMEEFLQQLLHFQHFRQFINSKIDKLKSRNIERDLFDNEVLLYEEGIISHIIKPVCCLLSICHGCLSSLFIV